MTNLQHGCSPAFLLQSKRWEKMKVKMEIANKPSDVVRMKEHSTNEIERNRSVLVSVELVEGIDCRGIAVLGTLLFVPYFGPEKVLKPKDC
jgi:hypothetical protein